MTDKEHKTPDQLIAKGQKKHFKRVRNAVINEPKRPEHPHPEAHWVAKNRQYEAQNKWDEEHKARVAAMIKAYDEPVRKTVPPSGAKKSTVGKRKR